MKQVTFWNGIIDLDRNEVFFHGVHGSTLRRLQNQVEEDGNIVLWGRNEDDFSHDRGKGEVSVSSFDGMQLSIDEFSDENGVIFIMAGENPVQKNSEEYLIQLENWKIVGGLRTTDDPEVFEMYTMQEMVDL